MAIIAAANSYAQTTDEYNKNEFFVGFSHQQIDRGDYSSFNGAEGSYVRNVSRYFGIKGDVSAAYRNDEFSGEIQLVPGGPITRYNSETKGSIYNFLGGVQVKDNASTARLKPFGHALAGVAHNRNKFRSTGFTPSTQELTFHDTGFSAAIGGGLDIKINDRFDFRAIQADYNPVRINNQWTNNFRFGIGIVIK